MSALTPETAFDEYIDDQLTNCLNFQTSVIQNLTLYSQRISYQLLDIKNDIEILANRVIALQQQQQQQQLFQQSQYVPQLHLYRQPSIPPSNPMPLFRPTAQTSPPFDELFFSNMSQVIAQSVPLSFSTNQFEPPSRSAPYVFDPIIANTVTSSHDEVDNTYNSYEPNIIFEPIVQLSPVEVKTGEEEENILFCERAKLYRFDSSSNEIKERGIGEMKILQHQTTNRCRILMRRDQVFKVCANHKITSQMELKPYEEKVNSFVWSAVDFADGLAKSETLYVKFKTTDQANRFFQQFNDSKKINANL